MKVSEKEMKVYISSTYFKVYDENDYTNQVIVVLVIITWGKQTGKEEKQAWWKHEQSDFTNVRLIGITYLLEENETGGRKQTRLMTTQFMDLNKTWIVRTSD